MVVFSRLREKSRANRPVPIRKQLRFSFDVSTDAIAIIFAAQMESEDVCERIYGIPYRREFEITRNILRGLPAREDQEKSLILQR